MEDLKAKPKRPQGRPKKYLDPDKAYTWFDEDAHLEAVKQNDLWNKEYQSCKIITGSDFENIEDFENALRKEYPDLNKLEIEQLYIMKGINKLDIKNAFNKLKSMSKPPTDKETYTVKIPAKYANEYSWYLSICEAFNSIRQSGITQVNVALIPRICANRIVLNHRSVKLEPNHYMFTEGTMER